MKLTKLAAVLAAGSIAATAAAEEPPAVPPRHEIRAERAEAPVKVDGVLDEPVWTRARPLWLDYEWFPGDNTPAAVATECRVAFDRDRLYLAFRAADPEPRKIRGHLADRDTPFLDDTVGFMIDPFADGRRAFQFRINAAGVQMEATNSDIDNSEDWSWDTIWDAAARIDEQGYTVEVALPFHSLRFPGGAGEQSWGFLALRDWPRSDRRRFRSEFRDRSKGCLVCQFGRLTGLAGISPGKNVELDPTLTLHKTDRRESFPRGPLESGSIDVEPGLTARWGPRPSVTLNAAINPDFSQVEADVAQLAVNNRFALFFPEKRPFFLEGADFFGTPIQAVFTRTVADPKAGLKVSGKAGRTAYGLFYTRDDINNLIFPANQGSGQDSLDEDVDAVVARLRRDVGKTSTVGLIYAGRFGGGYSNHLGGVDGVLWLGGRDVVRFQALHSSTDYPDEVAERNAQERGRFGGDAVSARYDHDSRDWFWTLGYSDFSRGLRADSGFVPRVDTRAVDGLIERFFIGKPGQWFSRLGFYAGGDAAWDHDGLRTDAGVDVGVDYTGPWQTQVNFNVAPNREHFDGRTYSNLRENLNLQVRPTGSFSFLLAARHGGDIDFANSRQAHFWRLNPTLEFNLGRRISGRLSHDWQRYRAGGARLFTANLTQLRAVYNLDRRTFFRAIVQYTHVDRNAANYRLAVEPESERLFVQLLFSYKLNPQTVVLLGYSDAGLGLRDVSLTRTDRTFFLKLGYAWLR